MNEKYQKVASAMGQLKKYFYSYIIHFEEAANGELYIQDYYGEYKVDFLNKTAYISLFTKDYPLVCQEEYFADNKIFFKENGQPLNILSLTDEDYSKLFEKDGDLSLFDFSSFNTYWMTTKCGDMDITFNNIYLPDYDFDNMMYDPFAYKVTMKANNMSYIVDSISYKGYTSDTTPGIIKYEYTKVAVDDLVEICFPNNCKKEHSQ